LLVQDALRLEQFEQQSQWPQLVLIKQVDILVRQTVRGRLKNCAQARI